MIRDLPDTDTNAVAREMIRLREDGGAVTLGRVLTLIIATASGEPTEAAIVAATEASREHPCRVIVVASGKRDGPSRLDAQIRVGGDAGASEIVVLNLSGELADQSHSVVIPFLLPDTPVVTWWPREAPDRPADDRLGRLSHRRITDSTHSADVRGTLATRLAGYTPGDSDIAWSSITPWRAVLTSALDLPPHSEITAARVTGPADAASVDLLAGWLGSLLAVPVQRASGSFEVRLERVAGPLVLAVDQDNNAAISSPGRPDGRVAMSRSDTGACLAEELRRLDTDEIYAAALRGVRDLDLVGRT